MADRDGRVRAGQLVVAQVALAAAAVSTTGPGWVLVGVSAAAAAVLVGTFGRTGGRWWYQEVAPTGAPGARALWCTPATR